MDRAENGQKEIVRQVESLFRVAEKIETHYKIAKFNVEKLARAILTKAFRGELIPQDPNDQPASELLNRIKEERVMKQTQVEFKKETQIQSRTATRRKIN